MQVATVTVTEAHEVSQVKAPLEDALPMSLPKSELAALVQRGARVTGIGEGSWVAVLPNFSPPTSPAQFNEV